MLEKLWCLLDKDGTGQCKGSDIAACLKDEKVQSMVLDLFAGTKGGNLEGCVSKAEFWLVMQEGSTQYPDDGTFCAGIEEYWKVTEDGDAPLDNIRAMHLLGLMRQRIITKANGQQEEFKLRDMFRIFD